MLNASVTGLLTGLSLIVAIGAQNAFVLRQGLRRAHVGAIVTVCILSDIALTLAGVSGIGAVVQHADWALQAVRWFGVAFLTWYGLSSAWRARRPVGAVGSPQRGRRPRAQPRVHAAQDTGADLAEPARLHRHGGPARLDRNSRGPVDRWWFAVGALIASTVWFLGLGFGARLAAPLLTTPRAWQVLDLLIAATMVAIAAKLAF